MNQKRVFKDDVTKFMYLAFKLNLNDIFGGLSDIMISSEKELSERVNRFFYEEIMLTILQDCLKSNANLNFNEITYKCPEYTEDNSIIVDINQIVSQIFKQIPGLSQDYDEYKILNHLNNYYPLKFIIEE